MLWGEEGKRSKMKGWESAYNSLQRNMDEIVTTVDFDDIIEYINDKKLLTEDEYDKLVNEEFSRSDRVRWLLMTLLKPKKDIQQVYEVFTACLRVHGYHSLYKTIDETKIELTSQTANAGSPRLDREGWTDLHENASKGRIDRLQQAILANSGHSTSGGTEFLSAKTASGHTALMLAVENGHADAVLCITGAYGCSDAGRWLVDNGLRLDAVDAYGSTALHNAAWANDLKALKMLRGNGMFSRDAKNLEGDTALHVAVTEGHLDAVKLLIADDEDGEVTCSIDEISEMTGWTALHTAIKAANVEIAELLIAAGANVGENTRSGETCLGISASVGSAELTELLLNSGADPQAVCVANWTPLHAAAREGFDDVIRLLIAAGADTNVTDDLCDETPLQWARKCGRESSVSILENA